MGGLGGKGFQAGHRDVQNSGHDIQKSSRTGGALIVHHKIGQTPLTIDLKGFDVLPTDVDDCACTRKKPCYAPSVTAYLTDLVISLGEGQTPISRDHKMVQITPADTGLLQSQSIDLIRTGCAGTQADELPGKDLLSVLQDDGLG